MRNQASVAQKMCELWHLLQQRMDVLITLRFLYLRDDAVQTSFCEKAKL